MQQRLASLLDPPITFAHRGARAHAPENTIESFQLGLRLGATGLESDVWVTADGHAVLDHDGIVRSRGRKKPIREVARASLPSHIPTVAEMLDACGGDYAFSLDLKDIDAAASTIQDVRDVCPELEPRLWLCHWDVHQLIPLREAVGDAKLVDSTRLHRIKEGPERRASLLRDQGIDAVNMHHTDWNGGLVTLFHRFERVAFGWDMQHEHILRTALRMGLDGVYSDWVDRMMDAYRAEIGVGP